MRTPRLPELALALSLSACALRDPEPAAAVPVRHDTHEAVHRTLEAPPLSEADAIIAEMEMALKELQAPTCEGLDSPRKARLKAAIKKAQDYLAKKNVARQEINLNCSPVTLGTIVEFLKIQLKEANGPTLAQKQ